MPEKFYKILWMPFRSLELILRVRLTQRLPQTGLRRYSSLEDIFSLLNRKVFVIKQGKYFYSKRIAGWSSAGHRLKTNTLEVALLLDVIEFIMPNFYNNNLAKTIFLIKHFNLKHACVFSLKLYKIS